MQQELINTAQALQTAMDVANKIPDLYAAVKMRVANRLRNEINFINSLTGQAPGVDTSSDLPPLTHIMGEEIKRHEPVTADALQPTNMERDKFIRERDDLYSQFLDLKSEQIYAKTKQPGGEAIVRAIAKKAGITNYADAKMGQSFIETIRKAIQKEKDLVVSLHEAEDKLKG